jgi:hypothetical protein
MARKVSIIIPTSLSELFEEFVSLTKGRSYERFSCGTPLLTRYKMTRPALHGVCISIRFSDDVMCSAEKRIELLYSIARDLLDPITIVEP